LLNIDFLENSKTEHKAQVKSLAMMQRLKRFEIDVKRQLSCA
jgi:hypothetical protein